MNRQEEDAFLSGVYEKHCGTVLKIINKKLPDFQVSDRMDVLSDTFTKFMESVRSGQFKGEHGNSSVIAFLYTIATCQCADFIKYIKNERKYTRSQTKKRKNRADDESNLPQSRADRYDLEEELIPDNVPSQQEIYETKIAEEEIFKTVKYPEILRLREEGYSIEEIAVELNMTYDEVWGKIRRKGEHIEETGLINRQPHKKSSRLMTSKPIGYYDKEKKSLEEKDLIKRGYTLPAYNPLVSGRDEREEDAHPLFRKGHIDLINKMTKLQEDRTKNERVCVKCHRWARKKEMIVDNGLPYCRKCIKNINKFKSPTPVGEK